MLVVSCTARVDGWLLCLNLGRTLYEGAFVSPGSGNHSKLVTDGAITGLPELVACLGLLRYAHGLWHARTLPGALVDI
jgi:hypothetical protein